MYTISEAARRAGVTPELLRAWERRYAVVAPQRTASHYRLYDDSAIRRLQEMRRLVDGGWAPSAAAASLRDVADTELEKRAGPGEPVAVADADDLSHRFVTAAAAMDAAMLQRVVDEIMTRASFEVAAQDYLFPALRALGRAWAAGDVSIAAEHAASAAVQRRLGAAFDAAAHAGRERPVLVGLPPGVRHELGALAFAVAARRAGLAVRYLGPDLPADDWVRAVQATRAVAAVIGVPGADDVDAARSVARQLRRHDSNLVIAFGGRGSTSLPHRHSLPDELSAAIDELRYRLAHPAMRS